MTASEVIDQIRTLPPPERAKVLAFVLEEEKRAPGRTADDGAFAESAKWVFNEHADLMRKLSQ